MYTSHSKIDNCTKSAKGKQIQGEHHDFRFKMPSTREQSTLVDLMLPLPEVVITDEQ